MAEFALVLPILTLLMVGMMLAGFYAYRAAAADYGIFITGIASGAYDGPNVGEARTHVMWPDIRAGLQAGQSGAPEWKNGAIANLHPGFPSLHFWGQSGRG